MENFEHFPKFCYFKPGNRGILDNLCNHRIFENLAIVAISAILTTLTTLAIIAILAFFAFKASLATLPTWATLANWTILAVLAFLANLAISAKSFHVQECEPASFKREHNWKTSGKKRLSVSSRLCLHILKNMLNTINTKF